MKDESLSVHQDIIEYKSPQAILTQLNSGQLLMVNSRRRNGLIIYKRFHAEFAGPGAAVGGFFDIDCQRAIPVGDLSLVYPEDYEDRQRAYLTRRMWVKQMEQFTSDPVPLKRAQKILSQFENYFAPEMIAVLPDEAFALMVGVLPQSIRMIRRDPEDLNSRIKF